MEDAPTKAPGSRYNSASLEAIAEFIALKAEHVAGGTLRRFLDGEPLTAGLEEHGSQQDDWLARFPGTTTQLEALFGQPK